MSIGMSYDEFWNQDVELVKVYMKADELKRSRLNELSWLQGLYIYEALCDVAPIFHAFAKKGTKPQPYVKEPYPITETEIRSREEQEARVREERIKAEFAAFAARMQKRPDLKGGDINVSDH